MMATNWTPGPWQIGMMPALKMGGEVVKEPWPYRENDGSHTVRAGSADDVVRVATVSFQGKAKRGQAYSAPDPEGLANSRLIASAPDLVAALEGILAAWHGGAPPQRKSGQHGSYNSPQAAMLDAEPVFAAYAALAKATGNTDPETR